MRTNKRVLIWQVTRVLASVGFIAVGMLLAALMFFAQSSYAERAQSPLLGAVATPIPGGPGYIMLAPGSFHADSGGADYSIDIFNRDLTQGSGAVNLFAPVQLPHGAKVTRLIYYCYDNTIFYTDASLVRSSPADYGTLMDVIYIAFSTSASPDQTIVDDTPGTAGVEVVDNSRYSYMVHLHFSGGSGMRAYGVRIDYEYGNFLPRVLKDGAH